MRMNDLLRRLSSPGLTKQQYLSNLNDFSRLCRAKKSGQLFQLVEEQSGSECSWSTTTAAVPRVPSNATTEDEVRLRRLKQEANEEEDEDDEDEDEAEEDAKSSLPALEDIFCCLKNGLFHDAAEVRAAALRAIRYLLKDEASVRALLRVNLPIFIVRSIDIVLENRTERIQALRLVRKFLSIAPYLFPSAFTRSLIAIAQDGQLEHDTLTRACWALLAELSIMSPISSTRDTQNCAFNAIMDAALTGNQPHGMCESLISTLLYMLNWPRYRCLIRGDLDLQIFVAPFTDSHYTAPISKDQKQKINQTAKFDVDPYDQRENKSIAAKITLISILRSWPGLVYLCEPQSNECNLVSNSCLKSLINMLYLPYSDVRRRLIDLILELLYLHLPDSTTDFETGLKILERHQLSKDSWKIHDAFVVDEAKAILPPLRSRTRMNLVSNYLALLLVPLFHCNVVDALSEVIVTPSNQENSTRATILLYQLLSLSYRYLPTDSFSQYLTLSTLIAHATSKVDDSRDLANAALTNLGRVHPLKKSVNHPSARSSLFLGQILEFCSPHLPPSIGSSTYFTGTQSTCGSVSATSTVNSLSTILGGASASGDYTYNASNHSSSSSTSTLVNNTKTTLTRSPSMSSRTSSLKAVTLFNLFSFPSSTKSHLKIIIEQDWQTWDWEHINFFLTRPSDSMKKISSQQYKAFIKRLVHFFKPSSNQYSLIDINNERCRQLCETGCNMIDFLIESPEPKAKEFLKELLLDLSISMHEADSSSNSNMNNYLSANSNTNSLNLNNPQQMSSLVPHSDINILNSSKLITTMSSTYFIFIGRLSSTIKGYQMLEKASIIKLINNLTQSSMLSTSPAEVYVKLIISCLDYTKEFNGSRKLLEKFLFHHSEENVRLYATNFLRVLLRANVPDFSSWAIELLVRQLDCTCRVIHNAVTDILDEACDDDDNLEGLIAMRQVTTGTDQIKSVLELLRSTGDPGVLLLSRYASSPTGLRYLTESPRQRLSCPLDSVLSETVIGETPQTEAGEAKTNIEIPMEKLKVHRESIMKVESEFDVELNRWQQIFNYRYVKLVEDVLNNSLTYHQKGEDGKYGRRIDRIRPMSKNSYLPPHLYGQLALHPEGIEVLISRNLMTPVYEMIRKPPKDLHYSEVSVLKFKAALWIIGHVGSSESGYQMLDNSRELVKLITNVAKSASVLSLRGTAFYVLGLLSSTEEGAEEMKVHRWIVQPNSKIALPLDLDLILSKPNDDNIDLSTKTTTTSNVDTDVASSPAPSGISADSSMLNLHPSLRENYSMSQLEQIRRDVLKYVTNLSGSVASRPAENSLLNLKRKYGPVFQYDLALYSEICQQLARYNFRLHARRFIQEIFLSKE